MNDRPIGELFIEGKTVLQVAKSKAFASCSGCWYGGSVYKNKKKIRNYPDCYRHKNACTPANRKDKKHVIFIKIYEVNV